MLLLFDVITKTKHAKQHRLRRKRRITGNGELRVDPERGGVHEGKGLGAGATYCRTLVV